MILYAVDSHAVAIPKCHAGMGFLWKSFAIKLPDFIVHIRIHLKGTLHAFEYTNDDVPFRAANHTGIHLDHVPFRVELDHVCIIHLDSNPQSVHIQELVVRAGNSTEILDLGTWSPNKDI